MLKDIRTGVKGNKTVYAIVSVLMIIVIGAVLWKIYKGLKAGSGAIGNSLGNAAVALQYDIAPARVGYIREQAYALWDKGVSSFMWVRNYDEAMFINTINGMGNGKEALLLSQFYKEKSGENLREAIDKSFSDAEKNKVRSELLTALYS